MIFIPAALSVFLIVSFSVSLPLLIYRSRRHPPPASRPAARSSSFSFPSLLRRTFSSPASIPTGPAAKDTTCETPSKVTDAGAPKPKPKRPSLLPAARRATDGDRVAFFVPPTDLIDTPGSWPSDVEEYVASVFDEAREGEEGSLSDASEESYVRFGRGMTFVEEKVGGGIVVSPFSDGGNGGGGAGASSGQGGHGQEQGQGQGQRTKGDRYDPARERGCAGR